MQQAIQEILVIDKHVAQDLADGWYYNSFVIHEALIPLFVV